MKLHLPKGLRTALLAVFSFATLATTSAAADDSPFTIDPTTARYGAQVKKTSSFSYIEKDGNNPISIPSMEESWVISLSGEFYPNYMTYKSNSGTGAQSSILGASVIVGNVEVPVYYEDWLRHNYGEDVKIRRPKGIKADQFAIVADKYGYISVVTSKGVKQICSLGAPTTTTPLQVTLNWVYDEDTRKGSLYLLSVGVYGYGRPDYNGESFDGVTFVPQTPETVYSEKYTILKDISITQDDMDAYGGIFTTAPSGSYHEDTLYSAGGRSDPHAWLITGLTDVDKLENSKTYGGKLDAEQALQFTGSSGALIYTGTGEYTYDHTKNLVESNILMGDMNAVVGFGAWKEGSKLIVSKDALTARTEDVNGTQVIYNDIVGTGVNIYGKGTVKLELGENEKLNLKSMAAGSTLEFSNTRSFFNANTNPDGFKLTLSDSVIGAGTSIIRTDDSTVSDVLSINLQFWDGNKYYNFDTLQNSKGGLNLYGAGVELSDSGKIKRQATSTSDIKNVVSTGDDAFVGFYGGVFNVDNVRTTGSVSIGRYEIEKDATADYRNTTVNVGKTLAAQSVEVIGSAHLGDTTAETVTFLYDSSINNTLSADSITTRALGIDVSDPNNLIWDSTNNEIPAIPSGATFSLLQGATEAAPIITDGFSASVSGQSATIAAGSINKSIVDIQSGTYIEEIPQADGSEPKEKAYLSKTTTIVASKVSEIDFTYSDYRYNIENEVWEKKSTTEVLKNATGSVLTLSSTGISAATLSADTVVLPHDNYGMTFGELKVATKLAAIDSEYLSNVAMTGVTKLKSDALTAASVSADNITLSEGFVFDSSLGTEKASLKAADTLYVGENATLNNADISTGQGLTLNNNTTLNNTRLSGKIITNGKIDFNQAGFSGMGSVFGGHDGHAFTVDPAKAGVESVIMDADLDGNYLRITDMNLYAEGLTFTADGNTYEVLTADATRGGAVDYEVKPSNNSIYIQPWVKARIEMLDGKVAITGREAMEEIKEELCTSDNRTAAMDAINELEPVIRDGSPLSRMHDYLGHVHRYSQSEREALLSAISGASTTALADSQRRGVMDVQNNLRNRIIQMGGATSDNNSDWDYKGLQAWAQADGSFASISGSDDAPGYNYDTWGATVGADIELSSSTVLGISCSASYGDIDVDGADHAKGTNDAQYVSLFARYQSNRWVQMLILTAGQNEFELDRNVLGYTGEGSTEGTTLSAYYELGYTMGLNYEYTQILQPLFSVRITKAEIDQYSESGNIGNASIDYKGDSFVYGSVSIGARYQGVLYTSTHERNAVVEARALISQDFGDATDEAEVALGGGSMYKVNGAETFGTSLELGAGLSIPLQQHTTLFADADLSVSGDYNSFRANIGLRYDF